jgi:hypothetical protein
MFAYNPQSGTKNMSIEYKLEGRNERLSGLSIDKRNITSVMISTKTLIILHFPRISSHRNKLPRRLNEIQYGGANQATRLSSRFM